MHKPHTTPFLPRIAELFANANSSAMPTPRWQMIVAVVAFIIAPLVGVR